MRSDDTAIIADVVARKQGVTVGSVAQVLGDDNAAGLQFRGEASWEGSCYELERCEFLRIDNIELRRAAAKKFKGFGLFMGHVIKKVAPVHA